MKKIKWMPKVALFASLVVLVPSALAQAEDGRWFGYIGYHDSGTFDNDDDGWYDDFPIKDSAFSIGGGVNLTENWAVEGELLWHGDDERKGGFPLYEKPARDAAPTGGAREAVAYLPSSYTTSLKSLWIGGRGTAALTEMVDVYAGAMVGVYSVKTQFETHWYHLNETETKDGIGVRLKSGVSWEVAERMRIGVELNHTTYDDGDDSIIATGIILSHRF